MSGRQEIFGLYVAAAAVMAGTAVYAAAKTMEAVKRLNEIENKKEIRSLKHLKKEKSLSEPSFDPSRDQYRNLKNKTPAAIFHEVGESQSFDPDKLGANEG